MANLFPPHNLNVTQLSVLSYLKLEQMSYDNKADSIKLKLCFYLPPETKQTQQSCYDSHKTAASLCLCYLSNNGRKKERNKQTNKQTKLVAEQEEQRKKQSTTFKPLVRCKGSEFNKISCFFNLHLCICCWMKRTAKIAFNSEATDVTTPVLCQVVVFYCSFRTPHSFHTCIKAYWHTQSHLPLKNNS
jgi:hypothetical protein